MALAAVKRIPLERCTDARYFVLLYQNALYEKQKSGKAKHLFVYASPFFFVVSKLYGSKMEAALCKICV